MVLIACQKHTNFLVRLVNVEVIRDSIGFTSSSWLTGREARASFSTNQMQNYIEKHSSGCGLAIISIATNSFVVFFFQCNVFTVHEHRITIRYGGCEEPCGRKQGEWRIAV